MPEEAIRGLKGQDKLNALALSTVFFYGVQLADSRACALGYRDFHADLLHMSASDLGYVFDRWTPEWKQWDDAAKHKKG